MSRQQYLNNLHHSCAHLLAGAVMELWPKTKRTIGPSIDNGFYYDFDFGKVNISENDFPKIEAQMRKIVAGWKGFVKREISVDEAKKVYSDNNYKLDLITEFANGNQPLTFYKSGSYEDLCRGGHCEHPDKELTHFRLLSIAGAYWRGSEKKKMLTRIYGTCWPSKDELDSYLQAIKDAEERDHRKIGKELDLFVFSDLVGKGLPLFTEKGATIWREISRYIVDEEIRSGY